MTSKDIRTLYDIGSKEDGLRANAILQTRPPCSNVDAAGFNCLTVVVRRIYSHCLVQEGYDASPGWLKKSEGSNPILSHAWHKFGQTSTEATEGEEDRKRAFAKLRDLTLDPYSCFENLCHSKLMNCTLWAQNVFRLIDHLHGLNTGNEVKVKPDVIAQMSLLELDHVKSPEMTLDDAVDRAFGVIDLHEPVVSRPARPWAVRVLYHSHGEEERRLGLKDLRYLQLPVWEEDLESSELRFHQVGKTFYSLMAIVRLRDEVYPKDFVRTYSPHGCNIVSEYEPLAFMESKWRLTGPSARYMLFYGYIEGEPEPERKSSAPLHEVAMPERLDSGDIDVLNKYLGGFKPFSAKPSGGPSNSQQKGYQGLQTPQKRPAPGSSQQTGSQEQENPQGEREPPRKRKRNKAKNKGNPQSSQSTQPAPHESEVRRDARRD
ncbi:Ff.00g079210.m01.CDS01 [Fusarium sp. VM40]|nr:Ff.00g079210.m01.CDS01 [Fusarium sp. VM40]